MAFSLSGVGGLLFKWVINPLFWVLIILVILGFVMMFLVIRKKRALKYPTIEFTEYGINKLKSGWFGLNMHLRGLWWTGRETLRTDEGEIIEGFSEEDFTEVDGQRGIIIARDPISKRLFPIRNFSIDHKSRAIMAKVPPREFIDTAIDVIKEASKETKDRMEKVLQFVAWALVLIVSLLMIIFIVQLIKSAQEKASNLVLEAGKTCLESAKSVCSNIANLATGSNAP